MKIAKNFLSANLVGELGPGLVLRQQRVEVWIRRWTVQRASGHHQHFTVVRHLEHHVVVQNVQRVVQRIHSQRRRPVQLDLQQDEAIFFRVFEDARFVQAPSTLDAMREAKQTRMRKSCCDNSPVYTAGNKQCAKQHVSEWDQAPFVHALLPSVDEDCASVNLRNSFCPRHFLDGCRGQHFPPLEFPLQFALKSVSLLTS